MPDHQMTSQLARYNKTPSSDGSVSSSADELSLVKCAVNGHIDRLVFLIRRHGCALADIEAVLGALAPRGDSMFEPLASYSERFRTTPVHELFREAEWPVLDCVEQRFPKSLLRVRERINLQTVYHVFAQRLRVTCEDPKTYTDYMPLFFLRAEPKNLLIEDASGCTAVHYLARYRHEEACRRLRQSYGVGVFRVADGTGNTAVDLQAQRLNHDLQRAEHERDRLQNALRIAEDSIEQYEAIYGEVAQNTMQKAVQIEVQSAGLTRIEESFEQLRDEKTRLLRQQAAQQETIARIEHERDEAHATAAEARAALAAKAEELEAQRNAQSRLHTELERQRGAVAETEREIDEMTSEQEQLESKLAELFREKVALEQTADDTEDQTKELTSRVEQMQGAQEKLRERMREAEETRLRVLREREEAEERYGDALERTQELEDAHAKAESTCRDLRARLDKAAETERALQEQAHALRADLERVQCENDERRAEQLQKMRALQQQRDDLEAQLSDERQLVRRTREQHEARAREIEERLKEEQRRAADAIAQMREKDKVASEFEDTLERQARIETELCAEKEKAEERMRVMEDQLKQNKLRFADVQREAAESIASAQRWQRLHAEELERAKAELDRANSKLAVAGSDIDQYKIELDTMRGDVERLAEERDKLKKMQEALAADEERRMDGKDQSGTKRRPARSNSIFGSKKRPELTISAPHNVSSPTSTPRGTLTPRSRMRSGSSLRGIDLPQSVSLSQEHNSRVNRTMWNKVCMLVQKGDYERLKLLFGKEVGLSPNTIDTDNRCLLEVAMIGVRDCHKLAHGDGKQFDRKDMKERVRRLSLACQTILDAGGDWQGLDDFVREAGGDEAFPSDLWKRIANRDDFSPFCRALMNGDTLGVSEHIGNVENLDRVPTNYRSHGYTYLMVAIVLESAAIVQQLVQKGADTMKKDKQGRTPLHLAVSKMRDKQARNLVVEYLLAGGADPNAECSYKSFVNLCKEMSRKYDKNETRNKSSRSLKLALRIKRAPETVQERRSKESEEATAFGTPLKFATISRDEELIDLMTNYRYRRLTVKRLSEYVVKFVKLNALYERMCRLDELAEDSEGQDLDPLTDLYNTYRFTYAAFNPYFRKIHLLRPFSYVQRQIELRAGIAEDASPEERARALEKQLKADETIAFAQSAEASKDKLLGNANNRVLLGNSLLECIEALQKQWFDVRDVIELPAEELYPEAICSAARHFVMQDQTEELSYMYHQGNSVLGNIDVNTELDADSAYTAIEVAAENGKLRVFEMLLDKQRGRHRTAGADGRTPIMIALSNHQPAVIVASDYWTSRNKESRLKYEHGMHYRTIDMRNKQTVLHKLAAQTRDDLLRFCLEYEGMTDLLDATDELNRTPADVAHRMRSFVGAGSTEAVRAAEACVFVLENAEGVMDDPKTDALPPPPALSAPPPLDLRRTAPDSSAPSPNQTPRESTPPASGDDTDAASDTADELLTPRRRSRRKKGKKGKKKSKD